MGLFSLLKHLPSMHAALALPLPPGPQTLDMVGTPVTPAFQKAKVKGSKLEVIFLGYMQCLRSAWDAWDVSQDKSHQ